jgi:hypothetical protein
LKLKAVKYCINCQMLFWKDTCINYQMLYWKDPSGSFLRCLDPNEVRQVIFEFHDNFCGGHHLWRRTSYKIIKGGYYWPSLFTDFCAKIRSCDKCQIFTRNKQLKSFPLNTIVIARPFQQWVLDFIGEIHPPSSGQNKWILTIITEISSAHGYKNSTSSKQ